MAPPPPYTHPSSRSGPHVCFCFRCGQRRDPSGVTLTWSIPALREPESRTRLGLFWLPRLPLPPAGRSVPEPCPAAIIVPRFVPAERGGPGGPGVPALTGEAAGRSAVRPQPLADPPRPGWPVRLTALMMAMVPPGQKQGGRWLLSVSGDRADETL